MYAAGCGPNISAIYSVSKGKKQAYTARTAWDITCTHRYMYIYMFYLFMYM